jgi:hypothetical protein
MRKALAVSRNILALITVVVAIAAAIAALTGHSRTTLVNLGLVPPGPSVVTPSTPLQTVASEWKHLTTITGKDAEKMLTSISPRPEDVWATVYGNSIHVWYRGNGSQTDYKYEGITWNEAQAEKYPAHNDGTIVPIGFTLNTEHQVSFIYFSTKKKG